MTDNLCEKFRASLIINTPSGPALLKNAMDDWQRDDFASLDQSWLAVCTRTHEPGTKMRAWIERPRGHSKSSDISAMCVFALIGSQLPIRGLCVAVDEDQAAIIRDAVALLVRLNVWLQPMLDVQQRRIINQATGSELQILSSDVASSWGQTPQFVICDEISHWPKSGMWESIFSSAAKGKCLLIAVGNSGWTDSWQWPIREAIRNDEAWIFRRLEGTVASWISAKDLDEQRRLLPPLAFDRLWNNVWQNSSGDALAPDLIQAACRLSGPTFQAERSWQYFCGVDLGVSRDASAVVVVAKHVGHSEETEPVERPQLTPLQEALVDLGRMEAPEIEPSYKVIEGTNELRLCTLQVWQPTPGSKVNLTEIETALIDLHRRFRLTSCGVDPWQAQLLLERVQRAGVPARAVDFQTANLRSMCQATLDSFSERKISIWPDSMLLADLRSLRIKESGVGVRLISSRGVSGGSGHGDLAQALQLALLEAKRHDAFNIASRVEGPLICWP